MRGLHTLPDHAFQLKAGWGGGLGVWDQLETNHGERPYPQHSDWDGQEKMDGFSSP